MGHPLVALTPTVTINENGTTAENELEALINEGAPSVENGVVWMIRWNGPDAELTKRQDLL
jgi:hypothetical protein